MDRVRFSVVAFITVALSPLLFLLLITGAAHLAVAAETTPANASTLSAEAAAEFERDIRPLLAERCHKCHGPNRQEAGLRLDTHEGLLAGGDSGPSLAVQDSGLSLLVEAVRRESLEMPPDDPLPAEEVELLARWVKAGAPWPKVEAPLRNQRTFSDEDRNFWSLRPVSKPEVPTNDGHGWARGAIDRFVWRQLAASDQRPAEEADRYALLRRLCFDLWGMPPTPEQIEQFVNDSSPDAYEKLVDRLLESPRYGERWAQHWLDLVRYADSDGFKRDDPRPHAWRYRDYVIRAFNKDRPYDQFVTEQLAGDEIAPDDPDVLVATGYFHCGIYESNQANIWLQRTELLNDITDVTGDVFLGMSMSCARCHDHKFDPVLQEDYYRLQAFFSPLVMRGAVSIPTPEQQAQQVAWEAETTEVRTRMNKMAQPHMKGIRKSRMQRLDRRLNEIADADPSTLSQFDKQIAALVERQLTHESINIPAQMKGKEKTRWQTLEGELAQFDSSKPKNVAVAHTAADVGASAPPTIIPGDTSERDILPGPLTILDAAPAEIESPAGASESTGRRTALARWLTRRDNPLTARVMANRIWQHHFGEGLVATPSNFGVTGAKPHDAELLDHLATQLVDDGWSLKSLHRRIVTSATYRQKNDGSNDTVWRFAPRRLEGEQFRDALYALSDRLDDTAGGPPANTDSPRRSIYLKKVRNSPPLVFSVFDVPERIDSVARRDTTTTPIQALLVLNDPEQQERIDAIVDRIADRGSANDEQLVSEMFLRILNRPSTSRETKMGETLFADVAAEGRKRKEAIADLTWALLNSHEFLFVR